MFGKGAIVDACVDTEALGVGDEAIVSSPGIEGNDGKGAIVDDEACVDKEAFGVGDEAIMNPPGMEGNDMFDIGAIVDEDACIETEVLENVTDVSIPW